MTTRYEICVPNPNGGRRRLGPLFPSMTEAELAAAEVQLENYSVRAIAVDEDPSQDAVQICYF